jgi:putative FmdB family regulatory protein
MPLYSFRCEQCEETFEIRASFKEKETGLEPECPQCESKQTRQLLSAPYLTGTWAGPNPTNSACGPDAEPGCC